MVQILGPLPKGGWHDEVVTGGYFKENNKNSMFFQSIPPSFASQNPPPFRQGRQFTI